MHFPKLHGLRYENIGATDPRRYGTQCKRCIKPAKPGQSREDVTEPKIMSKRGLTKAKLRTKRRKEVGPTARRSKKQERERQNEARTRIRRRTRISSMQYLAKKGCEECGERDPRVLEYDHKKPKEKHRNVGRLITDGFGWESPTLKREVKKCRILCSNCHRKHTIVQQGYYADEEVQRALGKLAGRYQFDL